MHLHAGMPPKYDVCVMCIIGSGCVACGQAGPAAWLLLHKLLLLVRRAGRQQGAVQLLGMSCSEGFSFALVSGGRPAWSELCSCLHASGAHHAHVAARYLSCAGPTIGSNANSVLFKIQQATA